MNGQLKMVVEQHEVILPYDEQEDFIVTLVQHGYMGTSPDHPQLAIAFSTLMQFYALSSRCLNLSIQAFVRHICETRENHRRTWMQAANILG